jgi:hypothetical protein
MTPWTVSIQNLELNVRFFPFRERTPLLGCRLPTPQFRALGLFCNQVILNPTDRVASACRSADSLPKDPLISRLTLTFASRQNAHRMNAQEAPASG